MVHYRTLGDREYRNAGIYTLILLLPYAWWYWLLGRARFTWSSNRLQPYTADYKLKTYSRSMRSNSALTFGMIGIAMCRAVDTRYGCALSFNTIFTGSTFRVPVPSSGTLLCASTTRIQAIKLRCMHGPRPKQLVVVPFTI